MHRSRHARITRRAALAGLGGTVAALTSPFAAPRVARAQAKTLRVGMNTILSGRFAQLGTTSRNGALMEVDRINATGGLAGRTIELVVRDSKGQPQEAARIARELINTDGCEILLDAEASSGAFAVHEVARDLGFLCIHTIAEASALTADPKQRIPNAFRGGRQGIHDSIAGSSYAAGIVKARGLTKWATCSSDYAYGRDTTGEFVSYLKRFTPQVEIVADVWPKLFAPDYTESVTRILQAKPQALYSCLTGGDLTSFIDQANLYALFAQTEMFAVNMADYTALTAVKNLPKGIHSGNRYIKMFPATTANAAWADAYKARFNEYPTNWSWENANVVMMLAEAAKKANSADGKKLAEVMRGLTISSPFGADGAVTMRESDHTLVGYAVGWGTTIPTEPYVPEIKAGDWTMIFELEAEWKKSKGWA